MTEGQIHSNRGRTMEPNDFLINNLNKLRKGKTLDLSPSTHSNSAFLSSQGFTMVEKVKNMDFFVLPIMSFDSIIMSYFNPVSRYWFDIKRGLVQGGTILIENYTTDIFSLDHHPDVEPKDCFKPNELLQHLQGLRILFYQEITAGKSAFVQCLAKKPYEKDALKYGFATSGSTDTVTSTSGHAKKAEDLFKKK